MGELEGLIKRLTEYNGRLAALTDVARQVPSLIRGAITIQEFDRRLAEMARETEVEMKLLTEQLDDYTRRKRAGEA